MANRDGERIPFENAAYPDSPHGPYLTGDGSKPAGDVVRDGGTAVDIRGAADWKNVFRTEVGDFSWGQLIVGSEAIAGTAGGTNVENFPWAEIRVIVIIGGIEQIWYEGAAGRHGEAAIGGDDKSPGPIFLPFLPGEVPDTIEVWARARRGGLAEAAGDVDEVLKVTAATRFRK